MANEMRIALANLIGKAKRNRKYREFSCSFERDFFLAEELIENGVIVLPCKVGTPVFIINKKGQIFNGKFRLDDLDQFGKRVFLTRSEAEGVLKAE